MARGIRFGRKPKWTAYQISRAIKWLIALMVLCCDPLAIALTAAASALPQSRPYAPSSFSRPIGRGFPTMRSSGDYRAVRNGRATLLSSAIGEHLMTVQQENGLL